MSVGLRNRRIDVIRGVSILLVLFHHFNIAYRLDDTVLARAFGWDAVRALARNGNYGVTMFFVVSGYLITSNSDRRWIGLASISPLAFYIMRAARIFPCLLMLLAVVNLLAAAGVEIFQNHLENGQHLSFWLVNLASLTFWMNVLISRDGWFNYPLGVLWSLSVEEIFYFSFPIICLLLRRDTRLFALWIAIIILGPIYRLYHQGDEGGYLYAYFASFDGIAVGCCTALLAKQFDLRGGWGQVFQTVTVACMVFLYLWKSIANTNILGVTAIALGIGALILGAPNQISSHIRQRNRALLALECFGRISYELYLFHLIVLGVIRTAFPPTSVIGDKKLFLLTAFIAFSSGLSTAIARLYAEPLNRGIRSLIPTGPIRAGNRTLEYSDHRREKSY